MTSEWKDHVAYCALEMAAEKETVPYGYDDLRDEHTMFVQDIEVEMRKSFEQRHKKYYNFINNEVSDIEADLKKYWHATQGDK